MYRGILLLSIVSLLSSCDFLFGVKNLGDGYYFDIDQILFTTKPTYGGIGLNVVPMKVLKVKSNSDFVIAFSLNKKSQKVYWMIDKRQEKQELYCHNDDSLFVGYYVYSNVLGPVDSFGFAKLLIDKHVDLHF